MPKKPDSQPAAFVGYLQFMPWSEGSSSSQLNESQQIQIKDRYSYKHAYGGGSSSFTGSCKAGKFVAKRTGGLGYKQEAKCTSTAKHVDKELGFTTECQTQVKYKMSVYPNKTQVKKSASPKKTQAKVRKSASPYKRVTKSYSKRIDYY
ncbi:unnamed protein product [Prunus armeniaca]|uniref:Uncharacterized protein n=1 Tax=Prunus armeniaca TaxID=36596 RepID=A0A6J5V171_PRUAR|nr:unnamed protein product [Prunus armeniaca]CAB4313240.1 unnamed protein product [Prunus armeniaca]